MLPRQKIEDARRADLPDHHVGALVGAVGHFGVEQIGQTIEQVADIGLDGVGALLQRLHLAAQRAGLVLQISGVQAATAALPDLPGQRVPPGLMFLQQRLRLALLGILGEDRGGRRRQAAACQSQIERLGFGAYGASVVHQTSTGFGST